MFPCLFGYIDNDWDLEVFLTCRDFYCDVVGPVISDPAVLHTEKAMQIDVRALSPGGVRQPEGVGLAIWCGNS